MSELCFERYYPAVSTLSNYFDALLGERNACRKPGDPASFRRFVDTTIVGHAPVTRTCAREAPTQSVRATAIDAIHQLLQSAARGLGAGSKPSSYKERGWGNMFAEGYVMKKDGSKNTVQTNSSLLNLYVNSSIVELNNRRWKILLDRVGNAALKRLFTETAVFISLTNKNYRQMSGVPLVALERPPPGQLFVPPIQRLVGPAMDMADRPVCRAGKRSAAEQEAAATLAETQGPAKRACVRFQAPENACSLAVPCINMMYSVPRMCNGRRKNGRSVSWELPPTFVLNKCGSPDQLLRCIFAETVDLETEMPPVLVVQASRMLRLHQKFNYRFHLFKGCPAPWQGADARPEGDEKASADSAPDVLQMASARSAVYQFLQLCIQRVVPRELIGGKKNHRGLYKLVRRLVDGGCFEQISLTEAVSWFVPAEVGSWLGCAAPSRAFEAYARLIYWILADFVVEIVRHFFYVTESSSTQYAMHFYRKDVWLSITKGPWRELVNTMYDTKGLGDLEAAGQHGCSSEFHRIRLLPKERSFRAIVNMKKGYVFRRKTPSCTDASRGAARPQYRVFSTLETSRQLSDALAVMRNLRQASPEMAGSSVFSPSDMYARLRAFKQLDKVRPLLGKQTFYMAKCDIQSAFDTIDQDKLMWILRNCVFRESQEFTLYRYWLVSLTSDVSKRSTQCAVPSAEAMPFGAELGKLAQWAKQTVFGDRSDTHVQCSDDILGTVEKATRQSFVRSSTGFFLQRKGIPQGSVLSTMLCNVYYAQMEREHLDELIDPSQTMVMRLVDDFFIVSASRQQVEGLLERMMRGIPEYGCSLNKEKTLANFDTVINGHQISRADVHGIPWCGKLICDRTLDVMIDFGTFVQMPRIDRGLRVNTSKVGGYLQLRQRMLKAVRPRMVKLFMDCDLNSELTVAINLYQHLLICAKKMHVYHRRIYVRSSPAQLFRTIADVVMLANVMLRSNCGRSALSAADVTWLGMHAFRRVLRPKQARYVQLLGCIKRVMDQPRFVRFDRKFESVVESPLNDAVHSVVY